MTEPLLALGARRTSEVLFEALVPLFVCIGAWRLVKRILGDPSVGRALSTVEIALVLGAFVVVFAWYGGRQLVLFNQRNPWRIVFFGSLFAMSMTAWVGYSVKTGFDQKCVESGGQPLTPMQLNGTSTRVCRIGGVPGNPYLPGTLLRASWDGQISAPSWVLLALLAGTTIVGTRHRRLRPTRMGISVAQLLRLAPAAGASGISGGDGSTGLAACNNPTLWGETCGQPYPADKEFEPGEWCVRCSQVYTPCERHVTLRVVSLFTADVDVLNGLERLDALSWNPGEPMPPDARLSGQERWVQLGTIEVPDVLSVAQILAHVHEQMGTWEQVGEEAEQALELAIARASRLSAWIWTGAIADRLTYARPTERAVLALGPSRLRDLLLDSGEALTLQLDVGLLPLELRTAFRRTFLDPGRDAVRQNTKQDLWVPVAPRTTELSGLWVPRVEGTALRRWLSLDRLQPASTRGVTTPLPYTLPEETMPESIRAGSLDLIRAPLDARTGEPALASRPGDSLAEWDWMEQRQIELLRQQALVMVQR